jgi:hypothetical protein
MDDAAQPARPKRWRLILGVLALLLLSVTVPPFITLNRFRSRLESSMSGALGRKVTVQDIHLHLLPAPGFDLNNFLVEDDAAFSSEPLLRADAVSANLRLTSLLRGRIEISTLSLKEPSLNLVRASSGVWNVEAVLSHAAQIPTAPTGRQHAEARPRFPYIEATGGRINFKFGPEKKRFAFSDADFALWLASEQEWGVRLAARPVRTDADLGDTGVLKFSGRFQRTPNSRTSPLRLTLTWDNAQLGQITELIYGRDRGWRGGLTLQADISGSLANLIASSSLSISDFRRYDLASNYPFNAAIQCDANYLRGAGEPVSAENASLPGAVPATLKLQCSSAKGGGWLTLQGTLLPETGQANLALVAASFPMSEALALAKHVKKGLAEDLTAEGFVNGRLVLRKGNLPDASYGDVQGGWETWTWTAQVDLSAKSLQPELNLGVLVFNFEQPVNLAAPLQYDKTSRRTISRHGLNADVERASVSLLPARVPLGGASPATLSATANSADYSITLKGEADALRLVAFLEALGLPSLALQAAPKGQTHVDLRFDGVWKGFAPPNVAGTIRSAATLASR